MEYRHTSVLLHEATDGLRIVPGGIAADGTLGGGGHAALLCGAVGRAGLFIGIDRDPEAVRAGRERLSDLPCRKIFVNRNFDEIGEILREYGMKGLDGALLDLGVSSKQLDDPMRGFSYMQDGPLNMRMDGISDNCMECHPKYGRLTAEEVINTYSEEKLARIIREYGEERWAKRIAQFIARKRRNTPILSTGQLVRIIKDAIPASARRDGPHPAKRTFLAVRIEVNDELGSLQRAVDAWIDALNDGGRLAIITFHSLEDRIVKEAYRKRENPCECPKHVPVCMCGKTPDAVRVNRKPILPSLAEIEENPRARSAKLRIIEKTRAENARMPSETMTMRQKARGTDFPGLKDGCGYG
jgi:16S rRNA (cytosine1402-N4)-methyltransferase